MKHIYRRLTIFLMVLTLVIGIVLRMPLLGLSQVQAAAVSQLTENEANWAKHYYDYISSSYEVAECMYGCDNEFSVAHKSSVDGSGIAGQRVSKIEFRSYLGYSYPMLVVTRILLHSGSIPTMTVYILDNGMVKEVTANSAENVFYIKSQHHWEGGVYYLTEPMGTLEAEFPLFKPNFSPREIVEKEFHGALDWLLEQSLPDGAIPIRTADELAAIGGPQSTGQTYILTNDINITSNWRPIEDFRGTLDGRGHTVTLSVRANSHFATAGLFADIRGGTVTIRNLSVSTSGSNSISAQAPNSGNSQAFAGGLIGTVIGGELVIENVSFNGNVRASAFFDRMLSGISDNPFLSILTATTEKVFLPSWSGPFKYAIDQSLYTLIDMFSASGSRAYAGGLIGFIGGNANVRIADSFARGNIYSSAGASFVEVSALVGAATAKSFSGGLIGLRSSDARLTIDNTYVTNNVESSATSSLLGNPESYAGSLIGNGGNVSDTGTRYRLNTQNLRVNSNWILFFELKGSTNTDGISSSLTQAQMRNSNSFSGWDFTNAWEIITSRNDGFPFPRAVARGIAVEHTRANSFFDGAFSSAIGSSSPLVHIIDMPFSSFADVTVNGIQLTQDVHYTVASGSTQVTLLPSFLDTLEDGFHTLTVNFEDGIMAEEEFLILETDELEKLTVNKLYINDMLVYSADDEEALVADSLLQSLYNERSHYRIEYTDGHYIEGDIAEYTDGQIVERVYGNIVETSIIMEDDRTSRLDAANYALIEEDDEVSIDEASIPPLNIRGDFSFDIIIIVAVIIVVSFCVLIAIKKRK